MRAQAEEGRRTAGAVASLVVAQVQRPWDNVVAPFTLPRGLDLVLGDVKVRPLAAERTLLRRGSQGGSKTPGMVKTILEWRKTKATGACVVAAASAPLKASRGECALATTG
jgi:hypothetical protein